MGYQPTDQQVVYAKVSASLQKAHPKLKLPKQLGILFTGFVRDGYEVYFIKVETPSHVSDKLGTLTVLRRHGNKGYKLSFRPPNPFPGTVHCTRDFRTAHGAYRHGVKLYWKL